ncbi:MAG: hypothetical protein WBF42_14560 [Terracidiphilus sp.]
MNEREEFLEYFRFDFVKIVDRLDTMTESEILDGIAEVQAARAIYEEEFTARKREMIEAGSGQRHLAGGALEDYREAVAELLPIHAFLNSVERLRLRALAKSPLKRRHDYFGLLEDALNDRLEWLRKRPDTDT